MVNRIVRLHDVMANLSYGTTGMIIGATDDADTFELVTREIHSSLFL